MCAAPQLSEDELEQLRLYEKCASLYIAEAISQVDAGKTRSQKPHLSKLWALLNAHNDLHVLHEDKSILIERTKASGTEGDLLCAIGEQLPSILRDEINPWDIMVADFRLEAYWNNTTRFVRNYEVIAEYVSLLADKNPHLSILEIGAGTGGMSLPVLKALNGNNMSARFKRYTFTDTSSELFDVAKERLSDWTNLINFKALNAESDIQEQGFAPHRYDVVILGHGLDLVKSKYRVLHNIRALLKQNGTLIFIDTVSESDSIARSMVLGTLPEWWTNEVMGKHSANSFTEDEWHQALIDNQFSGLDVSLRNTHAKTGYDSSVMISKAVGDVFPDSSLQVVLITETDDTGSIASFFVRLLEECWR